MSDSRLRRDSAFRLPRRTLHLAGIAFCIGIILFCVVWLTGRKEDFYRPRQDQDKAEASRDELPPLPAPLAAGEGASDMPAARGSGHVEEARPAPPSEPVAEAANPMPAGATVPAEPPPPAPATPTPPQADELAPGSQPVPLPDQPAPQYPPAAARRGEQGTVVVRVEVDATGMPANLSLVRRSGSDELDQAALDAVRRWRFKPAQRDGQATMGTLDVPFDFRTR